MNGTITRIFKEAKDVFGFYIRLERKDGRKFSYTPGQYVMLAFPDDTETKRPFSIVEYSPLTMELLVLLKRHAKFTERMINSKIGQKLGVFGPYGSFTLHHENSESTMDETFARPLVFIAGGIGITPIFSMLSETMNPLGGSGSKLSDRIYLFYTAKGKDQMPLYSRIKESLEKHSGIRAVFYFTEEKNGAKAKRLSCDDVIRDISDYKEGIYYICGPGTMIESFRKCLLQKGVPENRIRSEGFI